MSGEIPDFTSTGQIYNISTVNSMKKAVVETIRYLVMALFLAVGIFFYWMERAANWVIGYNGKTEYIKKGNCMKCGKCCRLLAIQYPNFFNRIPYAVDITVKWHEFRYGFTYYNREGNYLLYSCNHLRSDNRCGLYFFRPRLCREYPKVKLYGKPVHHFGCGFYYSRRDGRPTFDEALYKADERI